eukprot:gene26813-4409_t
MQYSLKSAGMAKTPPADPASWRFNAETLPVLAHEDKSGWAAAVANARSAFLSAVASPATNMQRLTAPYSRLRQLMGCIRPLDGWKGCPDDGGRFNLAEKATG